MKNISRLLIILCASFIVNAHAESVTTTNPTTPAATVEPANKTEASSTKSVQKESEPSQSAYEGIKSGWNKFLDLLTGPVSN